MQAHIRTAEAEQFSEAGKFADYYKEGQLRSADEVAARIADWLVKAGSQRSIEVVLRLEQL
ncbi:MAG: hypothetical protein EOO60_10350 [Hymenobacter sp.]|nr:MAG: hypothetical protein EOO60_10350 [Hymenobacter sp.]